MKKMLTFCLLCAFALPLMGCETVAGLGRDVTNVSESIQNEW